MWNYFCNFISAFYWVYANVYAMPCKVACALMSLPISHGNKPYTIPHSPGGKRHIAEFLIFICFRRNGKEENQFRWIYFGILSLLHATPTLTYVSFLLNFIIFFFRFCRQTHWFNVKRLPSPPPLPPTPSQPRTIILGAQDVVERR